MNATSNKATSQHTNEIIEMTDYVEMGIFGSTDTPLSISHKDNDYATYKTLIDLELRHSDYYEYPECLSLTTICESMLLTPEKPYMWTIQEGNYTNYYGKTYEMPYLICKTPANGLYVAIYRAIEYEYMDRNVANYRKTSNGRATPIKGLTKLLNKWVKEMPELTIFMLMNAYDEYKIKTERNHRNVSDFTVRYKKRVKEIVELATS